MTPLASLFLVITVLARGFMPVLSLPTAQLARRESAVWYRAATGAFAKQYAFQLWPTCIIRYGDHVKGCVGTSDNLRWVAMTQDHDEHPANYVWLEDDVRTANCLIRLHHFQQDECISVRGSVCEAEKGTSKILNARVHGGLGSLASDEYHALQEASQALLGTSVNSDANQPYSSGVYLMHIPGRATWLLGVPVVLYRSLSIVFGGAEQC